MNYGPPPPYGAQAMAAPGPHGYRHTMLGELQLETTFFPLMWVLYLVSTVVELNGQRVKRPWGRSSWQLAPGPYVLRVGFNYIFGPMGWGQRQIMIYPGQTTALRYSAPAIIFLSGELFEVMPQQLPALRR